MPIPSYDSVRDIPLLTDDDLIARIDSLVGPPSHPHIWLMFLDGGSCQLPALLPYQVPSRPNARHPVDFARLIHEVGDGVEADTVFLTYERPGSWRVSDRDRTWLRALREASVLSGLAFRGPFLAHDSGVSMVPPDDYLGGS